MGRQRCQTGALLSLAAMSLRCYLRLYLGAITSKNGERTRGHIPAAAGERMGCSRCDVLRGRLHQAVLTEHVATCGRQKNRAWPPSPPWILRRTFVRDSCPSFITVEPKSQQRDMFSLNTRSGLLIPAPRPFAHTKPHPANTQRVRRASDEPLSIRE